VTPRRTIGQARTSQPARPGRLRAQKNLPRYEEARAPGTGSTGARPNNDQGEGHATDATRQGRERETGPLANDSSHSEYRGLASGVIGVCTCPDGSAGVPVRLGRLPYADMPAPPLATPSETAAGWARSEIVALRWTLGPRSLHGYAPIPAPHSPRGRSCSGSRRHPSGALMELVPLGASWAGQPHRPAVQACGQRHDLADPSAHRRGQVVVEVPTGSSSP